MDYENKPLHINRIFSFLQIYIGAIVLRFYFKTQGNHHMDMNAGRAERSIRGLLCERRGRHGYFFCPEIHIHTHTQKHAHTKSNTHLHANTHTYTHAHKQTKPHTVRQRMHASPTPAGAWGQAAERRGEGGKGGLLGDEAGGGEECVLCRGSLSYRRSFPPLHHHHRPVYQSWPRFKACLLRFGLIPQMQTLCRHTNTCQPWLTHSSSTHTHTPI